MTALQDWLSIRPADQNFIKAVCRPLLSVLTTTPDDAAPIDRASVTLLTRGVERC
jgi:hypothetical protein